MSFTERLAIEVDAKTGGAVSNLKKVQKEVDRLGASTDEATSRWDKLGKQFGISGAALKAGVVSGAAAAGAALVSFAKAGIDSFVGLAGEVRTFSELTGATAEDSSRFVAVMDDFGIAADTGSKAMFKLARGVGDGSAELDAFGVSVARTADGSLDLTRTVFNVADAYEQMHDPAQRAALLTEAFGRSGHELIPILEQGSDGLRRFFDEAAESGQILSQDDLDKAREYELAVDALGDATERLKRSAGSTAAGPLTDFANSAADMVNAASDGKSTLAELGDNVKRLSGFLAGPITGFYTFARAGRDATAQQVAMSNAANDNAQALAEEEAAAKATADAFDKLQGGLVSAFNAQQQYQRAADGVRAAQLRVVDAQGDLNRLLQEGAVDAREVARAQKDVEQAHRGVASAQRDLEHAQQRVFDVQKRIRELQKGPSPADQEQRAIDLAEAKLSVEDAERDLLNTRGDQKATTEDVERAELRLRQARLDLANLEAQATDNSAELEQARRDLADAEQGQADALQRVFDANNAVADSQAKLIEAQRGDLDFTQKVEQAKLDLLAAQEGVNTAQVNAATAAINLNTAVEAQRDLLNADADAVARVSRELSLLQDKYPELAPMLGAILGASAPAPLVGAGPLLPGQTRAPRRALGGATTPGGTYLVGDGGRPELLQMGNQSGRVLADAGGGTTIVNIDATGMSAEQVIALIKHYEKRNGPGWRS